MIGHVSRPGARTSLPAVLTLVIMIFALASGCTRGENPPSGSPTDKATDSASALQGFLAEAQADTEVLPDQIEVLKQKSIAFEDYQLAMERAFACMEQENVTVMRNGTTTRDGVTVLDFGFVTDSASGNATEIHDKCYKQHSEYVDIYWQTATPEGFAYRERREKALAGPLRECLEDLGQDVAPDASFHDLDYLASQLILKAFETGDASYDCYERIGYDTWSG